MIEDAATEHAVHHHEVVGSKSCKDAVLEGEGHDHIDAAKRHASSSHFEVLVAHYFVSEFEPPTFKLKINTFEYFSCVVVKEGT